LTKNINFILDVIRHDLLIGFILYSILFFSIRIFNRKSSFLKKIDDLSVRVILLSSVVYCILILVKALFSFIENDEYNIGLLLFSLIALLIFQLLRIAFFKKNILARLIICLFFLIDFKIIGALLAAYNSYMALTNYDEITIWKCISINFSIFQIVFNLILKILTFILLTTIYYLLVKLKKHSTIVKLLLGSKSKHSNDNEQKK
jgi:hypothetical protein